ncbi:MAG TPA: hypothetical protein DCZ00_05785 [Lactococcus sp.]|uniref:hypothetical protein n=1 Tax=Lactococcus TaxID=1357 RepID=UPI000E990C37|nr:MULTISPECIES: hypothetical protein [Lactococcus]HAP15103.1 hypothetical protein [Lactococcus sp.]HBC90939.1 hypothetical protein [Lactococcus sp.]
MFGIKSAREKELEKENEFLRKEVEYLRKGWEDWETYAEDLHKFFDRKDEDNQLIINDLNRQVMASKKAPGGN